MQDTGDAGSSALGSPVAPSQVLSSLMNDGTFDNLRVKIINQLKQNEEIRKYTSTLVESSSVLNTPGAESKSRRELFDSLRRELEGPVLERASKAAWELILSKDGVGKEITEKVDVVYTKLSGNESSASSPHDQPAQLFQERATVDVPPGCEPSHPNISANGHVHRRPDWGSTPQNDTLAIPSARKGAQDEPDCYHPPLYD